MKNSGVTQMVINTRERLISSDINGLQYMQSAALQQTERRTMNDRYNAWTGTGFNVQSGVSVPITAAGNAPLVAEVLGGLMVLIGTTSLTIQAGTLNCAFPTAPANPLDSPYGFVDDPGVQLNGVLNFVANAAGSTRVDIVECQPGVVVLTVENRDVFDPVTGLFVPTPVVKTAAARLTYRIRQGTAGAGFPGFAADWLPLAVAIHPPGTASFDDVTFYDVRPLVNDRWNAPNATDELEGAVGNTFHQISYSVDAPTGGGAGAANVQGTYNIDGEGFQPAVGTHVSGNFGRVCGKIYSSVPGVSNYAFFDANDAINQSNGLTFLASKYYYVVAVFPYGLPRWCRYTTTTVAGLRRPQPQRGILTVTNVQPDEQGIAQFVTLPAGMGMGDSHGGRLVAVLLRHAGNANFQRAYTNTEGFVSFDLFLGPLIVFQVAPNDGPDGFLVNLNANNWILPFMTDLLVNDRVEFFVAASNDLLNSFSFLSPNTVHDFQVDRTWYGQYIAGTGNVFPGHTFTLPIANAQKSGIRPLNLITQFQGFSGVGANVSNYEVRMLGFKIGW